MSFLSNVINQTTQAAINSFAAAPSNFQMSGVTVNSGGGNDLIVANGNYNEIYSGEGDDNILLSGDFNAVFDASGDNTMISEGNNGTFAFACGNNSIQSDGNNNAIMVDNGNNYVEAFGEKNLIDLGNGTSTVFFAGDANEVKGGATGDKTVHFWDANARINIDGGNKVIATLYDLILAGNSKYTQYAPYVTFDQASTMQKIAEDASK